MQLAQGPQVEIGEAIAAGWRRFWPNFLPLLVFAVVVWAVNGIIQLAQRDAGGVATFLLSLVGFLISQLIAIGWIKIALDITDSRPVNAEAVVDRFRLVLPYLVAAVLYALMVGIGLVLLIVPGIILAIVFMFYGFHIVDTGSTDPIGALKRSAELTRGHRWRLFLLGLVLLGLNILGLLLLIVGVLITSAISLLAIAHVYRLLAPVPAGAVPPSAGTP